MGQKIFMRRLLLKGSFGDGTDEISINSDMIGVSLKIIKKKDYLNPFKLNRINKIRFFLV